MSVIGLGCEGFMHKSNEEVVEFIDKAHKSGINFIDFFSPDPSGRSVLGNAIKDMRAEWIIQGHLCSYFENGQYVRTRDLKKVKLGFEDLLTRLQTDYIDIGMIHYVDDMKDFDIVFKGEIIEYAKKLKSKGIVKHLGISTHNPLVGIEAVKTGLIDVILFSINPCYDMLPPTENVLDLWDDKSYEKPLFNIDPIRQEFYELCERENVGIDVMKAFGGGDLLDEKMSPFKVALTASQCIHYCLTRPGVDSVMAGCKTIQEIDDTMHYISATNAEKDFSNVLSNVPNHTFKGKCVYCGHCAPCTVGISVADVNKFTDLCKAQGEVPETVREHYKALQHHASECIECGACMSNCPFAVNIIAKMKEAVKVFGY